jgi:aminoglycoside phosphotransferase (APT) family kinase protein
MQSQTPAGPAAVADLPDTDLAALRAFLATCVPLGDGELDVSRLSGGMSNVSLRATTDSGSWVLRRKPLGHTAANAHDMAREYRVLSALQGSPIPVPTVFGFCDDPVPLGAPFYVMSLVDGLIVHGPSEAEGLTADQSEQACIDLIRVLAALHAVAPASVGLGDYGRGEDFVSRRLAGWLRQWDREPHRDLPQIAALADRLRALIPAGDEVCLVHGDYRLGNVVLDLDAAEPIQAVLDWELSTLCDPLTDLAHLLAYWEPTGSTVSHPAQLVAARPGFLTGDQMAALYADRTGRSIDALDFYIAYEHWRGAIIKEGIGTRRRSQGADADYIADSDRSVEAHIAQAEERIALAEQAAR